VVGVLSLIIATTGSLARFFIEILDETAAETMEPLLAAGASMSIPAIRSGGPVGQFLSGCCSKTEVFEQP
jgi:ABC-type phosphate/phosphonate transport system permease subunit